MLYIFKFQSLLLNWVHKKVNINYMKNFKTKHGFRHTQTNFPNNTSLSIFKTSISKIACLSNWHARGWLNYLSVPDSFFSLTSIFCANKEGLKLLLITTFTSILVLPASLTRGITRNGREISLVVRYLRGGTSAMIILLYNTRVITRKKKRLIDYS